ncbi:hypothetical protein MTO96_006703 [Rhipicephalus appendiculatus]
MKGLTGVVWSCSGSRGLQLWESVRGGRRVGRAGCLVAVVCGRSSAAASSRSSSGGRRQVLHGSGLFPPSRGGGSHGGRLQAPPTSTRRRRRRQWERRFRVRVPSSPRVCACIRGARFRRPLSLEGCVSPPVTNFADRGRPDVAPHGVYAAVTSVPTRVLSNTLSPFCRTCDTTAHISSKPAACHFACVGKARYKCTYT